MIIPDEIHADRADDIDWVKNSNNPAIWHEVAFAVSAFCGDEHHFLSWLVRQPDMDRGTAGWLLLNLPGTTYLRGGASYLNTKLPQNEMKQVMLALCERSNTSEFARDEIGLPPIFEERRKACLDLIANGELAADRVAPGSILRKPFRKPGRRSPYEVQDGQILSVAWLKSTLPDVYGQ